MGPMWKWDKYVLYEASVQEAEGEVKILEDFFRKAHGFKPRTYREDFCATFRNSCEWVKRYPKNKAISVDKDPNPLQYGRQHHLSKLTLDQQKRITLLQKDVKKLSKPKVDLIAASNFSICFMKTRKDLLEYLSNAYKSLKRKGTLIVDLFGGKEVGGDDYQETKFRLSDGTRFTYIWEQEDFNPIKNEGLFQIHYRFKNGRTWKRVFTYDWRIWSIAEMRDAMEQVGFKKTHVFWEGDDGKGGGNDIFERAEDAENCEVWLAYVVGVKGK